MSAAPQNNDQPNRVSIVDTGLIQVTGAMGLHPGEKRRIVVSPSDPTFTLIAFRPDGLGRWSCEVQVGRLLTTSVLLGQRDNTVGPPSVLLFRILEKKWKFPNVPWGFPLRDQDVLALESSKYNHVTHDNTPTVREWYSSAMKLLTAHVVKSHYESTLKGFSQMAGGAREAHYDPQQGDGWRTLKGEPLSEKDYKPGEWCDVPADRLQ